MARLAAAGKRYYDKNPEVRIVAIKKLQAKRRLEDLEGTKAREVANTRAG